MRNVDGGRRHAPDEARARRRGEGDPTLQAATGGPVMEIARGFGGFIPFPDLARAFGRPPLSGVLRREVGDFRVEEELGFEPEGSGPHHWLLVRKTGCTTAFAARILAERHAVPVREVGFSGLKDRHATTTQWFTVPARPLACDPSPDELAEGVRIVRRSRGRRKLRRGVHTGNRFAIAIRAVEGDREGFAERAARVARVGVPNYFGAQRFGRGAGNVAAAADLLRGDARPSNRLARGLYLSAARSLLFNRVLHRRVEAGAWDAYVPGDAIVIDGARRALAPGASPREGGTAAEWVSALRAHPTGPLWGLGASGAVAAEALGLERAALAGCEGWQAGLEAAGVEGGRRALRVIPSNLEWEDLADGDLMVRFALPRGAYATAVIRELFGDRDRPGP